MAAEVNTIVPTPTTETLKKELTEKSAAGEPILDEEGNIIPYPDYKPPSRSDEHRRNFPIPRLAAVASLKNRIPTAGEYAIERSKEPQPDLEIPKACYELEEERPWVLGKLNKAALELPEPAEPVSLPQNVLDLLDALERAANQVENARIKARNEDPEGYLSFDSKALYEKEKKAAITALQSATAASPPTSLQKTDPKATVKELATAIDAARKNLNANATAAPATVKTSAAVTKSAPESEIKKKEKKPLRPKSRNASNSPASKGIKKVVSSVPGSLSSSARASLQQLKPKILQGGKSPGRGGDATTAASSKLAPSPRTTTTTKSTVGGIKKLANTAK